MRLVNSRKPYGEGTVRELATELVASVDPAAEWAWVVVELVGGGDRGFRVPVTFRTPHAITTWELRRVLGRGLRDQHPTAATAAVRIKHRGTDEPSVMAIPLDR